VAGCIGVALALLDNWLPGALSENGRTIFLTAGERLLVDLGPGWTAPRINVLGGDPGPVTTPLRQETGPLANQTATAAGTSTTHVFLAVSAGNALITADPAPPAGAGGQAVHRPGRPSRSPCTSTRDPASKPLARNRTDPEATAGESGRAAGRERGACSKGEMELSRRPARLR